ncbi:hypothetical protein EV702DRAFT_1044051 [Suillus placidus]|uniref:Uncharacterized protein n=1 Tax=Suillus placidus TaxID=48579 RepID=A0A9P6ZYH0_9AGAM|nr:hypothetical protein EV702DRAFT_1044051 [Suillus placidus]
MPPRRKNASQVAPRAAPAPITAAPAPITATPAPITAAAVPAISTAAPVAATPSTATPAVAPIAAAVNAAMLQNPARRHQLPVRFRDNGSSPAADEGESFHLENISGDEEDEVANPPALTVTPAAGPSPLQTAMNTARTDPLATGGRAKPPRSSADVHFFFRQDPVTQSRICIACEGRASPLAHPCFIAFEDIFGRWLDDGDLASTAQGSGLHVGLTRYSP